MIKQVNEYFDQIKLELNCENEFGNSSILSNLLKSLLLVVEREIRKESGNPKENTPALTHLKFRNLLESNFKKGWSVAEYANELSISTKTLNSIIKKETGITVSHMIQDRILLEAKRQLTHTSLLINEIGYDLGFQDPYYFIKYFKKHLKCSAKEFRKSVSQFS